MTSDRFYLDDAITLEQYRALDPQRPLTDPAIGAMTTASRQAQAAASAAFNHPDTYDIANRNGNIPHDGPVQPIRETGCGTNAGYARHRRIPEPACRSCTEAHNRHNIAWRNAKRTRAAASEGDPSPVAPHDTESPTGGHSA